MRLLLICAGGALGSGARYLIASWLAPAQGSAFPWGTFAVNLLGSLGIGFVLQLGAKAGAMPEDLRFFLVTGVLGGFTTYSAFSYEGVRLFQQGSAGVALVYVAATVGGCFLLTWVGILVAGSVAR